jgi:hypothetical protein
VIALLDSDRVEAASEAALSAAAKHGFARPRPFVTSPAAGAHAVEVGDAG